MTIQKQSILSNNRTEALKHIKAAIDILCTSGDDKIAKESVANLGVVYFDLSE